MQKIGLCTGAHLFQFHGPSFQMEWPEGLARSWEDSGTVI